MSSFCKLACIAALGLAACSSDPPVEDAGDAGFVVTDAAPIEDAGVVSKCPLPENQPTCQDSSECNTPGSKPSNCDFCPRYNKQVCLLGACSAPAETGFFTLRFDTVGVPITTASSFAGVILTARTSGGETLTCAQVYAQTVDVKDPCYNVVDVRHVQATNGTAGVYPLNFGNFASGHRVLFIVYAFDNEEAMGRATGVSCTERDIAPAEQGPVDVEGDNMRILQ